MSCLLFITTSADTILHSSVAANCCLEPRDVLYFSEHFIIAKKPPNLRYREMI